MKKISHILLLITMMVVGALALASCAPATVEAGGAAAAEAMTMPEFITAILAMTSITVAIVATINLLKQLGVAKDGDAPLWNVRLHAGVYIALILWNLFEPVPLEAVDALAQQIAALGLALIGLVPFFAGFVAPAMHNGAKSLPVVGYSHSE